MVVRDGAGAVVSFQGITREVERLDYEAYAEMAAERIEAILARVREPRTASRPRPPSIGSGRCRSASRA